MWNAEVDDSIVLKMCGDKRSEISNILKVPYF